MRINFNTQAACPTFKQITITQNGQKALESNHYYYHLIKDSEDENKKLPNTKYWNLVIDGEREYDKHREQFRYNPVFKYISKITGETFEELMIHPPTTNGTNFHFCSSKNHKYLPPEVLLLSSNNLTTKKENVKELAFDIKKPEEASRIWEQYINDHNKDIFVYKALEEMSDKYESSLKIGIDTLLENNPEYKKEMVQIARRDNAVWFADCSIDQWT